MTSAPFKVEHALICEEVRAEKDGKHTILGLFGFSPHVKIDVQKLREGQLSGVQRLAFLFNAAPVDAPVVFEAMDIGFGEVGNESRFQYVKMPPKTVKPGKAIQILVTLLNPQMPTFGRYVAVLRSHGEIFARAEFELRQGSKPLPIKDTDEDDTDALTR